MMWSFVKELVWGGTEEVENEGDNHKVLVDREKENSRHFTGRVTQYDRTTSSGMIDNIIYFDQSVIMGGMKPKIGVSAHVEATRQHSLAAWKATKVQLINQWQPEADTGSRNIVGHVTEEGRTSYIIYCTNNEEITLQRSSIPSTSDYCPRNGDWVMLSIVEQVGGSDKEGESSRIEITDVKPLRRKEVTATIEYYTGRIGMIEGDIGFNLSVYQGGGAPCVGDTVIVECVECKHARMSWRAIKVKPINHQSTKISSDGGQPFSSSAQHALKQEEKFSILVSGQGEFGDVELNKKRSTIFTISNHGSTSHTLISCAPVSLKDQLLVKIININNNSKEKVEEEGVEIKSGHALEVSVELISKVLGRLVTVLVFNFGSFKINQSIYANVIDESMYLLEPTQAYVSSSQRRSGMNPAYHDRLKAASSAPGQRPKRRAMVRLPNKLKQFPIPTSVREFFELDTDVSLLCPKLLEPLSWSSYEECFSILLHTEELQMEINMQEFDIPMASMIQRGQYLTLEVPGLAEGRPSLLVGDIVIACEPGRDKKSEPYEGFIHEVHGREILLKFSERFHERFHNEDYDIMFTFNRTPMRRMHQSLALVPVLGQKILFPHSPSPLPPLLRLPPSPSYFNPQLNERQRAAVGRILGAQGRPAPYVVFGPPGTGKTVTVVEAILQVYSLSTGNCRILASAPSNSAADLIAERLLLMGKLESGVLVRLNAYQRSQKPPEILGPHCMDVSDAEMAARHKIIVCTCVTAGILYSLSLPVGHFTHVFIDEAGQATEPEALIPLGLLAGTERQVVLAGDPYQLGPVLQSKTAGSHGLGVSLLERIMNRSAYQRDTEKFTDHGCYDPLLVTKLVVNYRSHPSLLHLYSTIFYHGELVPAADINMTHSLLNWEGLTNPAFPLLFHGVIGEDVREGNSPSWFNPVEAVQVVRYVQSLLSGCASLTATDIGLIAPYRKQVEKIRLLLTKTGIEDIKVGSIEEFQGQEKKVIILSTVRSSPDLLSFDTQHNLGFLSNPKRFNVSISRAQALLIVVGNPNLLCKDQHWSQLVEYAVCNGGYTGCPVPLVFGGEDTVQ
ncbi:PREDICTED: putative helicase MOV-10 [Amphimedon queenslandica]|uniref:RNA helicase n=1 Tax=Amphimedon queenslandica TaxID=400682 RepID=A0A1X7UKT7_AMPQE|nr:PREDICTED: putative helicase MOV-10 [Amphimedon queenslandica]|eukprot:XP_019853676.1 PREDICTED: putative helicase MOV-10 [Amphimedon queenslandica]